jgi:hypothetical protein
MSKNVFLYFYTLNIVIIFQSTNYYLKYFFLLLDKILWPWRVMISQPLHYECTAPPLSYKAARGGRGIRTPGLKVMSLASWPLLYPAMYFFVATLSNRTTFNEAYETTPDTNRSTRHMYFKIREYC